MLNKLGIVPSNIAMRIINQQVSVLNGNQFQNVCVPQQNRAFVVRNNRLEPVYYQQNIPQANYV